MSREVIHNDKRQASQVPMWFYRFSQQRSTQDQDDGRAQDPALQEVR
jgi:hypothetical protein